MSVVHEFLRPESGRRRLVVEAHPQAPVSAEDLRLSEGGSWHQQRRLGLRVYVEDLKHQENTVSHREQAR
jgi:hypothetical protein